MSDEIKKDWGAEFKYVGNLPLAWYDPTNHHVSTDKHDPLFTPLGQLWPLGRIDEAVEDDLNNVRWKANYRYDAKDKKNDRT